jgi:hypothetical protein
MRYGLAVADQLRTERPLRRSTVRSRGPVRQAVTAEAGDAPASAGSDFQCAGGAGAFHCTVPSCPPPLSGSLEASDCGCLVGPRLSR